MIHDSKDALSRYASLHPLFARVVAYLEKADLTALAPGRYPIDDKRLFVIIENAAAKRRNDAKLECHRRYIDIQLVLAGVDEMGWRALGDCTAPVADYSEERDIRFFEDAPSTWIATHPGNFCIFFPGDAHAPLTGSGAIRKAIFKIAVDAA